MSDIIDITEERINKERASLINRVTRRVALMGSDICEDCGEIIPLERRKAAPFARRCIVCQSAREDKK